MTKFLRQWSDSLGIPPPTSTEKPNMEDSESDDHDDSAYVISSPTAEDTRAAGSSIRAWKRHLSNLAKTSSPSSRRDDVAGHHSHLHPQVDDPDSVGSWMQIWGVEREMPLAKDDAARCAKINELGVPLLEEAKHPDIKELVAMAGRLFDAYQATLTVHDHKHQYFKFLWSNDRCIEESDPEVLGKIAALHRATGMNMQCGVICNNRGSAMCNHTLMLKRCVVVRDGSTESPYNSGHPGLSTTVFPFYAGAPCMTDDGVPICVLCLVDTKPHPDFNEKDERQLAALAKIIAKQVEMSQMISRNEYLESQQQSLLKRLHVNRREPPSIHDGVTLVFTDVQSSTTLWEANPVAMESAIRLHDATMRSALANHDGYEITTEGDAFQMAFHDAFDAVSFCLEVQSKLVRCDWPKEILQHPEACTSKDGTLRGLRIRMAVHSGRPASVTKHDTTRRSCYGGRLVALTKSIEDMCSGGQILVSSDCFARIQSIITCLGSPQVVDLGEHVLQGPGLAEATPNDTGTASVGLFQILPSSLSHDYYSDAPGSVVEGDGRIFPAITSLQCTSRGFLDSPAGETVAICFVFLKGALDFEKYHPEIASVVLPTLRQCVRSTLRNHSSSGYECQEIDSSFMLAFNDLADVVTFAASLQQAYARLPLPPEISAGSSSRSKHVRFAVGALSGAYTSRGPHASTGRADYFGTIVNRAARIGAAAHGGQVIIAGDVPSLGNCAVPGDLEEWPLGTEIVNLGRFRLKGIDEPVALHEVQVPCEDGIYHPFPMIKTKGRV